MPTAAAEIQSLQLFPETVQPGRGARKPTTVEIHGQACDEHGHPLVRANLLGLWDPRDGWTVGWLVQAGQALDEWHPGARDAWRVHRSYPWYRLSTGMPCSSSYALAAGQAARAAALVLAQMREFVPPAAEADFQAVSDRLEAHAREWLCQ